MRSRLGLAAAAALVLLTGCSSSEPPAPRPTRTSSAPSATSRAPDLPAVHSYVAIGDSFTAGPGLAALRDGAGLCLRSDHNWPSLLQRRLDAASFADVSCLGAATVDLVEKRTIPGAVVPAQLDAVTPGTDLVTVGIGGNDGNLFTSLVAACTRRISECGTFAGDTAPTILDSTVPHVVQVLERIHDRAPDAEVLLVGYLRILPEAGTCRAVGVPAAAAAQGAAAERALDTALADAAKQADVDYLSMRSASRGHDACAGAQAWTNGADVPDDDGVAFHPRLAGMRAVAAAVEDHLAAQG